MASTRKDARKLVNKLSSRTCPLTGDVLSTVKDWLDTGDHQRGIDAVEYAARKGYIDLEGEPIHPEAIYLPRQKTGLARTKVVGEIQVVQAVQALRSRQGCEKVMEINDFSHLARTLELPNSSQQLIEATIRKMESHGSLILDQSLYPWQLMFLEEASLSTV